MPDTLVSGNSQNNATPKKVHTRSKFDLKYHNFDTFRFGELHPHFVMESVPTDSVHLRCEHNLRSYSLKAPLMQNIQMKKDYFAVPMECILPHSWDLIYTNPVIGDDVPSDAGTYIADFLNKYNTYLKTLQSGAWNVVIASPTLSEYGAYLTGALNLWLLAELIYSDGCLMSSLGIHLSNVFLAGSSDIGKFDIMFDTWVLKFLSGLQLNVTISGSTFSFDGIDAIEVRRLLTLLRDNIGNFTISSSSVTLPATEVVTVVSNTLYPTINLDVKRLWAYQLVCAHYYTNDHVDYIYSAELFRNYIYSLFTVLYGINSAEYYSYNGTRQPYDYLSSHYFSLMLGSGAGLQTMFYLQSLLGYNSSLRYMDYFVGSKTRPLAVGDVNVAVNSGSPNYVSIIDVTQRTQMQRFLNAVNRSGRKFSNYINELFGNSVAPDYHNPFYLGHTSDDVYGQEIENTNVVDQEASDTGLSIVSNLRSNASRFEFTFDCDRPSILIGITYFDIARVYWTTIERQNFHKDRFDMFNPYMQFIGDQVVYENEISPSGSAYQPIFGYQLRHAEYKQRYNQCAGGFVKQLPGYAFLNDKDLLSGAYNPVNIGPSFIRSRTTELDRFYVSLTGFSLGTYFHFIVDNFNDCTASRPMAYAPSIL